MAYPKKIADDDFLAVIGRLARTVVVGPTAAELADEIGLARGTVLRKLEILERNGVVQHAVHGFVLATNATVAPDSSRGQLRLELNGKAKNRRK